MRAGKVAAAPESVMQEMDRLTRTAWGRKCVSHIGFLSVLLLRRYKSKWWLLKSVSKWLEVGRWQACPHPGKVTCWERNKRGNEEAEVRVRWECASFIIDRRWRCGSRLMEVAAREGSRFIFKDVLACEVQHCPRAEAGRRAGSKWSGLGFFAFLNRFCW